MPDKKPGESKKTYMERCVPKLIDEGRNPDQAVAICNSMFLKKAKGAEMGLEVSTEKSVEFEAEVSSDGFKMVTVEDGPPMESLSFAEILTAFGCEAGKRYKIEICIEES